METLTIRGIDEDLKARLRVRAAERGRSMEAEVREILRTALARPTVGVATRIRLRFADLDDATVEVPERVETARAADLQQ